MKKVIFFVLILVSLSFVFAQQNTEDDPFSDMDNVRKMFKRFFDDPSSEEHKLFDNLFNELYGKQFGGSVGEIKKREDDKFVYYEVEIEGMDENAVNIKVEEGRIDITGKVRIEKKSESKNVKSSRKYISNFSRTIPVPDYVDPDRVQTESKETMIILKFPKIRKKKIRKKLKRLPVQGDGDFL